MVRPSSPMLDLSGLSAEQRDVVLAPDGPILVLAGPGSGKTTLLAARIAYLVGARSVPPTSILAVTFTTKAARELRERLEGVIGEGADLVDITTFHAFGLRIVRQWAGKLGFGIDPVSVYDEGHARSLIRELSDELKLDHENWPTGKLSRLIEYHRLTDAPLPRELTPLAEEYEATLRRRSVVDYAQMLTLPLELFVREPRLLRFYQDAYRYVLGDEFQDVNASQYQMLRLLAERHRNLVVVGDPAQTVFAWRGANVRFIADFQRDFPEARILSLHQNYRSTKRIVALANALGKPLGYNRTLWTENPEGRPSVLHLAQDERSEAEFVASEMSRLRQDGRIESLGDVAILYRVNWQAEEIALALREHRLPYLNLRSTDLFDRREVQDVLAYLRLADDPNDAKALARIVNIPPRRLGKLEQELRRQPVPLADLPDLAQRHGRSASASARWLVQVIQELGHQRQTLRLPELLDLVLERTGYVDWLESQTDGKERLAHLAVLRRLAERSGSDLSSWLQELLPSGDGPEDGVDDRVVLTTIHGAKGGEWKAVFVVGVEEGLLPHAHALLSNDPHASDDNDPSQSIFSETSSLEEELRVAYVAVTRPRELLYLTCCRTRQRGERIQPRHPSRFLRNLPPDVLVRVS
ncbi:MAG: UvrD-helicase domain-containing protein [Nitrososphaerota archaeon]|nr:UvrD-helicase domain-containing protein [Nitrososphaerota archaeon]